MYYFKDNNTQERFNKLSPRQQRIILNLLNRIRVCEGFEKPHSGWCVKCTQTYARTIELFMRFEKINRLAKPFGYDDNDFSDPTITGGLN